MNISISEVQVVPIKPNNGLVGFASCVLDGNLYIGSIGIYTKPLGGYRLTYPTKNVGSKTLNIYYPINKEFAEMVEEVIIKKFEKVMNQNDRHNNFNA